MISRLSKQAAQLRTGSCSFGSSPLQHYNGLTKVTPPAAVAICAISYREARSRKVSLATAQEKDIKWLNMLYTQEDAIEWGWVQ